MKLLLHRTNQLILLATIVLVNILILLPTTLSTTSMILLICSLFSIAVMKSLLLLLSSSEPLPGSPCLILLVWYVLGQMVELFLDIEKEQIFKVVWMKIFEILFRDLVFLVISSAKNDLSEVVISIFFKHFDTDYTENSHVRSDWGFTLRDSTVFVDMKFLPPKPQITPINLICQQLMTFIHLILRKGHCSVEKALQGALKAGDLLSQLCRASSFQFLCSGSGKSFGGMVHSGSGVAGLSLSGSMIH
ncbi:hypothetical protein Tco_0935044 [Tanacetum coccineum]